MRTALLLFLLLLCTVGQLQAQPANASWTTPGTYTWTVPAGVRSVQIEAWGAGGRGGTGNAYHSETQEGCCTPEGFNYFVTASYNDPGGGGGGGGAYAKKNTLAVTPGQTLTIVVATSTDPIVHTEVRITGQSNICLARSGVGGQGGTPNNLDHWDAKIEGGWLAIYPVFTSEGVAGLPGPGGKDVDSVGDVRLSGQDGSGETGGDGANGGTGGGHGGNTPLAPGGGGRGNNDTGTPGASGKVLLTYTVEVTPPRLIVVDQ